MRFTPFLLALVLGIGLGRAAAAPPVHAPASRPVMVRITVPLGGPEEPGRPGPADSWVMDNLAEGWVGVGILAVGGGVLLYREIQGQEQED